MKQLFLAAAAMATLNPAAAMAIPQPAVPAEATSSPPSPMTRATPKPKMICRTEDVVGSRLGGHRECHTEAEWRAMAQDSADYLTEMRNHRSGQY